MMRSRRRLLAAIPPQPSRLERRAGCIGSLVRPGPPIVAVPGDGREERQSPMPPAVIEIDNGQITILAVPHKRIRYVVFK